MSRVLEFSDGAERGDASWWTASAGIGVSNGVGESGAYCYGFSGSTSAYKTLTTPLSEMYFRMRVKFASTSSVIIVLRAGTSNLVLLTQNRVLNRLDITGATTGNTGNNSLTFGWQVLEVRYKISDTVGVLTVRIDGVEVFTFSGDSKSGADSTIDNLYIVLGGGSASAYFDDFALDTADWCGLGYYVGLTSNGAGDVTQWTPTGGANYANVSIPANDATYNTGTTGQTDNYGTTSTTLGAATVQRVIPFVRAGNPAGGTLNVGVLTEGVEHTTAVTTPTSLTWLTGAEYINNPQTGDSWTQAELDALQFVVDVP